MSDLDGHVYAGAFVGALFLYPFILAAVIWLWPSAKDRHPKGGDTKWLRERSE